MPECSLPFLSLSQKATDPITTFETWLQKRVRVDRVLQRAQQHEPRHLTSWAAPAEGHLGVCCLLAGFFCWAVPAGRSVLAGQYVALLLLPSLRCLLLPLQVSLWNLGGARMQEASVPSPTSVAVLCFAAELCFCGRSVSGRRLRVFI